MRVSVIIYSHYNAQLIDGHFEVQGHEGSCLNVIRNLGRPLPHDNLGSSPIIMGRGGNMNGPQKVSWEQNSR